MPPRTRTRQPTLSPSSSLPSFPSYQPPNDTNAYLSLSDFLNSPHTAESQPVRPSTAPPVESQTASQPSAEPIDSVLARCATAASKRAVARRLHEPSLASHSPIAREVMVEVSRELRETHDALMKCLYAPGGLEGEIKEGTGDDDENGEGGYKWSPSEDELKRVYGKEKGGREDEVKKRGKNDSEASEQTVVKMRGGGMHGLFGLKRRLSDAKSGPRRPEIISRPSEAFEHTGKAKVGVVIPGRRFEELQTGVSGPKDSRLLRVRQMGRLAPPSLHSNDGRLSSLAGSGKTASIVPEGTIASFYMGDQSRSGTLRMPSDLRNSQVSLSDFPSPPSSRLGSCNDTPPQTLSSNESDQSESTVRGVSSPVELPKTELQEHRNNTYRKPSIRGQRQKAVDESAGDGTGEEEPSTVRKLGSPMQSPIRDLGDTCNMGDRSSSTPNHQSGSHPPSSGYMKDSETTFFAPQSPTSPGRSIVGSLRKNKRPFRLSQAAEPPLPSVDELDSKQRLFPPGSALSADIALPLNDRAATANRTVEPSDSSVWQGGSHMSVAPEDSWSEVYKREHPRVPKAVQAPTALKQHRGRKTKTQKEEALQEVGEEQVIGKEAKERTEERFRDEVRRLWSHYQTRVRIINEDVEKTPQEKERAIIEEHKVLELLIGQASTDTGFEQLHEPWQKDEVLRNMFGIRPKTSKTPSILRKANKVMKWFLAVPDDPELKTWSSRKRGVQYSQLGPASLARWTTNATSSHPSRSTTARTGNRQDQQEAEGVPRSPAQHGHFHFARSPPVVAPAMRQPSFVTLGYSSQATSAPVKAGKMTSAESEAASETRWPTQSMASSESGWPTQSQLSGLRGA